LPTLDGKLLAPVQSLLMTSATLAHCNILTANGTVLATTVALLLNKDF
jgi:hypothetical protein